jgi:glycerate dehydrogenase
MIYCNFKSMKIVVLDGYTLNPGDLSWTELERLGELTVYDRTPADLILKRSEGAPVLITNKTPLGENLLNSLPDLKYIGVLATGFNVVDTDSAKRRGIIVTNVPAYSTASVAQLTFALLLELSMHVQHHSDSVFAGDWTGSPDFSYWHFPLTELTGKTIGIIGFGNIGRKVAEVASAFGMNIICYSRTRSNQPPISNFRWVEKDELFESADVVSCHCPLVPETKGLINLHYLKKMKKSAFLINTSRGAVIVEEDLAFALNNELIAGAGLDVLSTEPPSAENPLLKAKNCIITPHFAWATGDARKRLMKVAVDNLRSYLSGNPVNVVNS